MTTSRVLFCLCLAPALVQAQTNAAVTITDLNATYTQGAISLTETATFADNLNGSGGDILYQHWWWFRVGADTREFAFKQDATATRVVTNPAMVTTWPDVDSRGVFSAVLTQVIASTGPTGGVLTEAMQITNLTNAVLNIDLFSYTDYDVNGSGTDLARGNLSSQVVVDATNLVLAGEFRATANTGVEVAAYATVRTKLTDLLVTNLAGWNGTFASGDYTGAFQWTLTIPANGTATVTNALATMGCRPDVLNYGTGAAGTNGVPTNSAEYPVLRTTTSATAIKLANGRPNSLAALLLNLNQANQVLFGLTILVDPVGVSTLFLPTDAVGAASYALNLPPAPVFCGVNIFGQWLVSDPLGVGGLASSTGGVHLKLGAW